MYQRQPVGALPVQSLSGMFPRRMDLQQELHEAAGNDARMQRQTYSRPCFAADQQPQQRIEQLGVMRDIDPGHSEGEIVRIDHQFPSSLQQLATQRFENLSGQLAKMTRLGAWRSLQQVQVDQQFHLVQHLLHVAQHVGPIPQRLAYLLDIVQPVRRRHQRIHDLQQRIQLQGNGRQCLALHPAHRFDKRLLVPQLDQHGVPPGEIARTANHADHPALRVPVGRAPDIGRLGLAVFLDDTLQGQGLLVLDGFPVTPRDAFAQLRRVPGRILEPEPTDFLEAPDAHPFEEMTVAHQQPPLAVPHHHRRRNRVHQRPQHGVLLLQFGGLGQFGGRSGDIRYRFHQPGGARHLQQLEGRADMELLLEPYLVGADRLVAECQLIGDLLVAQALGEQLQHGQFARGQLSDFVSPLCCGGVEILRLGHDAGKIAATVQDRTDRDFQVVQGLDLADIGIRPGLHGTAGIQVAFLAAVDHHPRAVAAGLQPTDEIQAAQARYAEFGDQQIGLELPALRQGVRSVVRLTDDLVSCAFQHRTQCRADHRKTIRDQDCAHGRVPVCGISRRCSLVHHGSAASGQPEARRYAG
ncbi:hypothetical protein D9M68_406620 [compost metagenome]